MAFGLFTVLLAFLTYSVEADYLASLPRAAPGSDTFYTVRVHHHLAVGVTSGLIAMGLGAVLFYLRRVYLSRRP